MALEDLNTPTAVIVTTEFEHEVEIQRAALGMNDLVPVVVTHPISTLTEEQIAQRAREAADQAKIIWRKGQRNS